MIKLSQSQILLCPVCGGELDHIDSEGKPWLKCIECNYRTRLKEEVESDG